MKALTLAERQRKAAQIAMRRIDRAISIPPRPPPETRRPGESAEAHFERVAKKKGWRLLRGGWPDYLAILPDGHVRFIEVKSARDTIRPSQKAMLTALLSIGMVVEVWNERVEEFVRWDEHPECGRRLRKPKAPPPPVPWYQMTKPEPPRRRVDGYDHVLGC